MWVEMRCVVGSSVSIYIYQKGSVYFASTSLRMTGMMSLVCFVYEIDRVLLEVMINSYIHTM